MESLRVYSQTAHVFVEEFPPEYRKCLVRSVKCRIDYIIYLVIRRDFEIMLSMKIALLKGRICFPNLFLYCYTADVHWLLS